MYCMYRSTVLLCCRRPQLPASAAALCPVLTQLMEDCWHPVPEQRPTFKQIVDRLAVHLPVDCDPRGSAAPPVDTQVGTCIALSLQLLAVLLLAVLFLSQLQR
jgi:Protein tyrosine and serine/threonine kinase